MGIHKLQLNMVIVYGLIIVMFSCDLCHSMRDQTQCGPSKKCTCRSIADGNTTAGKLNMDCSDKQLYLKVVCTSIGSRLDVVELNYSLNTMQRRIGHLDTDGCQQLNTLLMSGCGIANINRETFERMTNLTVLDLSRNNLQGLYNGQVPTFLEPLRNLKHLKLRILDWKYNVTDHVTYPALSQLTQLESLHLDGLPNIDFQYKHLERLKDLVLSGYPNLFCSLDKLTSSTFTNISFIENLDISQCKVTGVEAKTFMALPYLKRLDISLNRQLGFEPMSNISYGLQFTSINFINYSRNYNTFTVGHKLTKQDICYIRNTTIKEVALDGLRLDLIETNALLLMPETLEIIHMNDNTFTFGLYLLQLACLKNLKRVEANFQNVAHSPTRYIKETHGNKSDCRQTQKSDCPFLNEQYLKQISENTPNCIYFNETPTRLFNAFIPESLKQISFTNCNLEYKVESVPFSPVKNHIESIDVSGNIAHDLQGPVGPLPALKHLNISKNYCTNIGPNFFYYMENLETLDMRRNFLGQIFADPKSTDIFKPLRKLKLINISQNQIKELLPTLLSWLVSLETLDLSYNSIDRWTVDTRNLQNLTHLYLKSNSLEALPESLTDHFTALSSRRGKNFTIDITNNRIKYTCMNRHFLKWMAQYQSSFVGFDTYVFMDDNGRLMTAEQFRAEVQNIDKMCHSYTLAIVLSTLGISVFLSVVISGMIYKNRWKLRYFLYMNKTRFRGYRSYEPIGNFENDAFISYSDENSDFRAKILQVLEVENDLGTKLKLCIHERDFTPGRPITDNIIDAIQTSKKTVIALSRAYLKSKWCLYEFHMARMESIYSRSGQSIMIIVMLEQVPLDGNMPLELMQWIRRNSYLEYTEDEQGQVIFWDKLREAILE